jgi:tetraacyldisaccharide-1-P 4'-kinase
VTTEKDLVRLTPPWRRRIRALAVDIVWEDRAALMQVLAHVMARRDG